MTAFKLNARKIQTGGKKGKGFGPRKKVKTVIALSTFWEREKRPYICRNRVTNAMLFFLVLSRVRGRCGFDDSRATAAGLFCLRLGGRDGCLSVWFWSSEEIRLSTNDSLSLSLFSAFLSRVMYLETH